MSSGGSDRGVEEVQVKKVEVEKQNSLLRDNLEKYIVLLYLKHKFIN
jgi:hypothetical protein